MQTMTTEIQQLELWVHSQLDGIARSSPNDGNTGAQRAFANTLRKIQEITLPHGDDDTTTVAGWNVPAVAPSRVDPVAVVTAQPAKGEVSREQIQSTLRAILTAGGGVLAALGMAEPEWFAWLGTHAALVATVIGFLLPLVSRVWSWRSSQRNATEKSQQVTAALQMPAVQPDRTLTTVEDVRAQTQQVVDAAKRTPVEVMIEERARLAAQDRAVEASPVERLVRKERE